MFLVYLSALCVKDGYNQLGLGSGVWTQTQTRMAKAQRWGPDLSPSLHLSQGQSPDPCLG